MEARQEHIKFLLTWVSHINRELAKQKVSEFTELLIRESGQGLNLTEADLSDCNLEEFNLRRSTLNRAQLYRTNLIGANLSGARLICPGMERTNLKGAILKGAYVHALAAQVCDFRDADLSELVDATGSLFHGCSMSSLNAAQSMFAGSTFYQCDLENANFRGSNLQGCSINECILDNANLSLTLLAQTMITKSRMQGTLMNHATGKGLVLQRLSCCDGLQLVNAELPLLRCDVMLGSGLNGQSLNASNADFNECSLGNSNFSKSTLSNSRWKSCHLYQSDFSEAKLDEASFSNSSILESIFERVMAENLRVVESRLPNAKMSGFMGRGALFRDCDLSSADLSKAYLYRAVLTGDPARAMCLKGVNLQEAILVQAYITADLQNANLRGARCTYARLNNCNMRGSDLSGIDIFEASLIKTDLTDAKILSLKPPFFADRCPGLPIAPTIEASESTSSSLAIFLSSLQKLIIESKH
jgi:uncharacterized protein YjbI with pentapeptide repeats